MTELDVVYTSRRRPDTSRAAAHAPWVGALDTTTRVKNALLDEVQRLISLVENGWFIVNPRDPPDPMTEQERAKYQAVLSMWTDPAVVLPMLGRYHIISGEATNRSAITAISKMLEGRK